MRTKVYSFKPKGKSYTIHATKTYGGVRNYSSRSTSSSSYRRNGGAGINFVSSVLANFIVRGIFGMKK